MYIYFKHRYTYISSCIFISCLLSVLKWTSPLNSFPSPTPLLSSPLLSSPLLSGQVDWSPKCRPFGCCLTWWIILSLLFIPFLPFLLSSSLSLLLSFFPNFFLYFSPAFYHSVVVLWCPKAQKNFLEMVLRL